MYKKDLGHTLKLIDNNLFFKGSPLSNMTYIDNYIIDGVKYSGVEQYYQYMKCIVNNKLDVADRILQTYNSFECKKLTKFRCNEEWLFSKRFEIMKKALLEKFSNNEFNKYLQSTKGLYLYESTYDKIWGIGCPLDKVNSVFDSKGLNILGQYLMSIRDGKDFPNFLKEDLIFIMNR